VYSISLENPPRSGSKGSGPVFVFALTPFLVTLLIATAPPRNKADVVEHPEVFDHVGLRFDEPPVTAGLPFVSSSDSI
jgi:hypothetical protein